MVRSRLYVRGKARSDESFLGVIVDERGLIAVVGAEWNYKRESSEREGQSSGEEPRGEKGGGWLRID